MGNAKSRMETTEKFVNDYLPEFCVEVLEWRETGILRGGFFREAVRDMTPFFGSSSMSIIESMVAKASMKAVIDHS